MAARDSTPASWPLAASVAWRRPHPLFRVDGLATIDALTVCSKTVQQPHVRLLRFTNDDMEGK